MGHFTSKYEFELQSIKPLHMVLHMVQTQTLRTAYPWHLIHISQFALTYDP